MKPPLLLLLGVLLTAAAYWPGLPGPFLLDDFSNVTTTTPATTSPEELADVLLRNKSGTLRRPVSFFTFAVNHYISGRDTFGYKLTNLLIHLAVGWVGFVLLSRLAENHRLSAPRLTAAICVAIWLVHPLSVSTVLYVVQRMAQLAGLFSLAAIVVYLGWRQVYKTPERPSAAAHIGVIVTIWLLTVLAILSKESGALTPLLLLLTEWTISSPLRSPARSVLTWTSIIPLAVGIGVFLVLGDRFLGYGSRDFSLVDRLATQTLVLWYYVGLIVLPRPGEMGLFHDDFPVYTISDPTVWLAILGWLAAIASAIAFRKRAPWFTFGIVWFLGAHAMESSIFPLELVFEHRNYIAMLGPLYAIVAFATKATWVIARVRVFAGAIIIALLAGATFLRASAWSTFETFALVQAHNHPESTRSQLYAIQADTKAGRLPQALSRIAFVHHLAADEAWPYLLNLNIACTADIGASVIRSASEAFATRPHTADVLNGLRSLVRRKQRGHCPQLSFAELHAVVEAAMRNPALTTPLGQQRLLILSARLAAAQGETDSAVAALKDAMAAYPENYVAALELAYLYLNTDRLAEARAMVPVLKNIVANQDRPMGYLIDEFEEYLQTAERTAKEHE